VATRRSAYRSTITGTISELERRVKFLQSKPSPSRLANKVVKRANIQPRAVDSDQLALQAVTNDQVAFDAIAQVNMKANSVGSLQLINGSVTTGKILDGAVVTDKILDLNVTTGKIGNLAVTTGKINGSAVTTDKLNDSAVTTGKINDSAVTTGKLQNAAVNESKLSDNSVSRSKIQTSAVGTNEIASGAVNSSRISTGGVATTNIADSAVTNAKIGGGAVSSAKLSDGSVTESKIAARAVTTVKIADNAVTSGQIGSATRVFIVNSHVFAGGGLSKSTSSSGTTIAASFGTGSGQIPRGNHTHQYATSFALAGASRHQHSGTTGIPSTTSVKKNISTHKPKDIKKLLKLEPKRYKYKRSHISYQNSRNKEWMYGYLLEELEELGFHEPIVYNRKGEPERLDYSLMSMLVLELVKTQQKEIENLEKEVKRLGNKND
jgi:hypothetical protein